jgi:hypothetical protein
MRGFLSVGGAIATGVAFLGWAALASKVSTAGFGQLPLTCLVSSGGACAIVYDVAQYETGLFTMIPLVFWMGAAALVVGIIVAVSSAQSREYVESDGDTMEHFVPDRRSRPSYNLEKWNALLKYDEDIQAAVKTLLPLGDRYIDALAADYLRINDKAYLNRMVTEISNQAEKSPTFPDDVSQWNIDEWKIDRAQPITKFAADVVRQAAGHGYQVEYNPSLNVIFRRDGQRSVCRDSLDFMRFAERLSSSAGKTS